MKQNNMLAMILAGGRGTRLLELTKKNAKPAVYFGGKYRIIDFPLSNCANSDINVVGVLTQYESVELNAYAGAGQRWGLDARGSGVYVLPPREKDGTKFDVYQGTADAITQNIDFIDKFDPEYVLILSGDHIYKMDYADMLSCHKANNADCTIAVLPVPMKEASRFGIMNTDDEGRIVEFEEKPEHPKSNLASMGIYIFNWKQLRKELISDMTAEGSHHDFGKDIIPKMFPRGNVYVYDFSEIEIEGEKDFAYWRDVGSIDSYWEAHMDLLGNKPKFNLQNPKWPLHTFYPPLPPADFTDTDDNESHVSMSLISAGCKINGATINKSVLGFRCSAGDGAMVEGSVLIGDNIIGKGAKIKNVILDRHVEIAPGFEIGYDREKDQKLLENEKKSMITISKNGIIVVPKGMRLGFD